MPEIKKIKINDIEYDVQATTADKLSSARTVSLSGAVSGSASFDGSKNISIATTNGQHISNKNSGTYYFPLATMVQDNSSNFGNITIAGRIGGWEQSNSANFEIMMLNRSSARDGNTITATVSASGEVDTALTKCDIVVYRQDDTSNIVYLKTTGYWLYDFDWSVYQHSVIYDGSKSANTPAGTLIWSLSTAPKTILSTDGTLYATKFSGSFEGTMENATKATQDASGNVITDTYMTKVNPTGSGNVSIGRKSDTTVGDQSIAIGKNTTASAEQTVAIGTAASATNTYAVAIGSNATASGEQSTAIGTAPTASGKQSTALGVHTTASGEYATSMGCWTTSKGIAGTSLGNGSTVDTNSWAAVSSGIVTIARGMGQHVFGAYNIPDDAVGSYSTPAEHLLIVGNGDSSAKSNAMTLDWDGNLWVQGNVKIGGSGDDSATATLATTDYVADTAAQKEHDHTKSDITDFAHTHAMADVSGLQSALDGKAASSHGTHVTYSTTDPVMDGTASAGSASTVARSDHKHPVDTSRAAQADLTSHTSDTTKHITITERTNWNAAKTHADSAHAPSNAEKNQNAFSNVVVGSTTIAADTTTDSLTLVAGSNVTLTPDATNDKITIDAKDTVYTHPSYTAKSSGLYKVTVDGTGHVSDAVAVAKSDITVLGIPAQDTTYSAAGSSLGLVKSGGDVTISSGVITVNDDSHNHIIANVDGLQAALDGKSNTNHTHADIQAKVEKLEHDASVYYSSLASAITDINNGTKANAITDISTAKVKVFTAHTGKLTVMLLDDVTESVQIDINKDIELVLNGKTLSFSTAGAYLNFAAGSNCAINGEVEGSKIVKNLSSASVNPYLVNTAGNLYIIGGFYECIVPTSKLIIVVRATSTSELVDIKDAKIIGTNNGGYDTSVSGSTQAATGIQSQCKELRCKNVDIAVKARVATGILDISSMTIENSTISSVATYGNAMGVYHQSDDTIILKNCNIHADGCDITSARCGQGINMKGTLICEKSDVRGSMCGIITHAGANVYVSGGTYNGFSKGGFYLTNGSQGATYINDAIITCGDYQGIFDYSSKLADCCVFVGGGNVAHASDMTIYMDGCTLGTDGANAAINLTSDSGELNNTLNISNSNIVAGGGIRVGSNTHVVNIGVGCNITADNVTEAYPPVMTDKLYRRNREDKVLDGNDFNALVEYIKVVPSTQSNTASITYLDAGEVVF